MSSSYTGYIIETFATLLGVCALALIVLWGARRLGLGRASGPIELYGHLPLDGRRAVYLVKVGANVFVVGVDPGGFTKLGEVAASELSAPSPVPRTTRFRDVLGALERRSAQPDAALSPQRDRSEPE
ncbi:MAG TPA: flagellar biosynthetic protein FliO [Polyangiaceae bacterium]|nr:flagellar biosynthetic protein FliO [Polyangiaceae bacterium]